MINYKAVLGFAEQFMPPHVHRANHALTRQECSGGAVQVHLVVTNEAQRGDEVPTLQQGDVKVKQGKNFLKVNQLIPAKGDNAALQLFILIDDTLGTTIGNNLNDIRDFINAQPATTVIAVGYMSNAAVQVALNFTAGLADFSIREHIQERRLAEFYGQRLLEGIVEDAISGSDW
jgi:hypothetical protein